MILKRLLWLAVALAAAGIIALIWLNGTTLCEFDAAGREICSAGPALGVPGAVLATFFLSLLTVFSLVKAFRRE